MLTKIPKLTAYFNTTIGDDDEDHGEGERQSPSITESVGQDNQITPEDRTAKRQLEVQSHAEEEPKFVWGYYRSAAPEAAQIKERVVVSGIEGNQGSESAVEGGFSDGNLHPVAADTGLGEVQQESGDQRMEDRGSPPEPCPQRIQPARYRRPPAWTKDYNLM